MHVTALVLGVLERDGVRLLGGDLLAAERARERIGALEAKLALTADQFSADALTGEQLRRISAGLHWSKSTARPRSRTLSDS